MPGFKPLALPDPGRGHPWPQYFTDVLLRTPICMR